MEADTTPDPKPNALDKLEQQSHRWRELLAGFVSVGIAVVDVWHFGKSDGFTSSLDEILILTGIALIAGMRNLFGAQVPDRKPPP